MVNDKSKWCATFLRKVRSEFYLMQSKAWYGHLLGTVDPEFCRMSERRRKAVEGVDLEAEARKGLAAFLSNVAHLNLPEGAELGVDGEVHGLGGNVYLTIRWPGQEPIPVTEIAHDPKCVESIWEDEAYDEAKMKVEAFPRFERDGRIGVGVEGQGYPKGWFVPVYRTGIGND